MVVQSGGRFSYSVGWFCQSLLENYFTQFTRLTSLERISCSQARIELTILEILWSIQRSLSSVSSSRYREMASVPDPLWWFESSNENPIRNHVSGGFLKKEENQGWDLFEDLAEKTLQWELASKKTKEFTIYSFKRRAPISRIIYSYEAKIATKWEE